MGYITKKSGYTWVHFASPRPAFRDAFPYDAGTEYNVYIKDADELNGKHRVKATWNDANGRLGAIKISAPAISKWTSGDKFRGFENIGRMKFKHIYVD